MRYFVECSHTVGSDLNTGIQRVVRNIVNQSLQLDASSRTIIPVAYEGSEWRPVPGPLPSSTATHASLSSAPNRNRGAAKALKTYARRVYFAIRQLIAALLPWPPLVRFIMAPRGQGGLTGLLTLPLGLIRGRTAPPEPLTIGQGDVLVLLDASWHLDIWPQVANAKQRGAAVVCVIYDLIPHLHPDYCEQVLVDSFARWMNVAMREADVFMCISQTVARQLREMAPDIAPERKKPFRTAWFWLGSELDGHRPAASAVPETVGRVLSSSAPLYLYVSTIEPRKNHAYTLAAFEQLWQAGIQASFAIVGRVGWRCKELIERIRAHPQFGKQLFLLNDVDDNALARLYDRANGLVFTSTIEGFGLPLVEAQQRGLPVFASDIPVFREIATEGVTFVDLARPETLRRALEQHLRAGAPRLAAPVRWLDWRQSAQQFWDRVDACLADDAGAEAPRAQIRA